jgi:WD40 repeat protein
VGHKQDVLVLDCSNQFVVSGGVDGIVSIWNVFSGELKYAIGMPTQFTDDEKDSDDDDSHDHGENKETHEILKSVVGLQFHPYYQDHICILQEGGDIHMVDCTNGAISHKNLGLVKMNSNWACDPHEMTMFVVGDVGRAILFDISMGGREALKEEKKFMKTSEKSKIKNRSPPVKNKYSKEEIRWGIKKNWFVAHNIHKMEP